MAKKKSVKPGQKPKTLQILEEQEKYIKENLQKYKRKGDLQGFMIFLCDLSMRSTQILQQYKEQYGDEKLAEIMGKEVKI